MQDSMRRLLVVQKIDTAIAAVEAELSRIPEERVAVEAALSEARGLVEQSHGIVEREELEERQLESSMRDQEALLAKLNDQCSQVTTNQAYEALQHEIEHATNSGSEFETRALELMETIDTAKSELASAREKLADLEASTPGHFEEISARESERRSERARLLEEREKEAKDVDPKVMQRYDRIATQRHPAVTIIATDACPECHIKLPRMALSELKRGEALHNCTNCQRLLVPEHITQS